MYDDVCCMLGFTLRNPAIIMLASLLLRLTACRLSSYGAYKLLLQPYTTDSQKCNQISAELYSWSYLQNSSAFHFKHSTMTVCTLLHLWVQPHLPITLSW